MKLTAIQPDEQLFPQVFRPLLKGAKLYDSSSSVAARVIYIDKDQGYFLKQGAKGALKRENALTTYFHGKSLANPVLAYISDEQSDWLLTEKVKGEDCVAQRYLDEPKCLCDTLAEVLLMIHNLSYEDCPVPNHTSLYLAKAKENYQKGLMDEEMLAKFCPQQRPDDVWQEIESQQALLQTDTLLHGDFCLPNVILDNWQLSGLIDLDSAGVGDKHVDIFWAIWTLFFNLKTDQYRKRFLDAYGRDKIDKERLKLINLIEVFG